VIITLRIAVRDDARAALLRDVDLSRTCNLSAPVIELDAGDPRFDRVLELTRDTSGCWLNPIMRFTAAETRAAHYYQLEGRKLVLETGPDNDLNRARLAGVGFYSAGGRSLPIKLIDRLALSRVALPPNAVGLAGDWMAEFVVGRGVAAIFEQERLTGYTLRPVFDPKTKGDRTDCSQLYCESIMPPAEIDATTLNMAKDLPDEGGWRELGCLTYELHEAGAIADFNRTAENWSNSFIPVWVVSARVREAFERHKLKGWAFRPVLEKNSPLHRTYMDAWSTLLAKAALNPRNRW
jgi:hypothetical protein